MVANINTLLKTCEDIHNKVGTIIISKHKYELSVRLLFYEISHLLPNEINKNKVLDLVIANILSDGILVENSNDLKYKNLKENYREYIMGETEEAQFAKCLIILHDTAMVCISNSGYLDMERIYAMNLSADIKAMPLIMTSIVDEMEYTKFKIYN